jgi:hypothetical protein
MVLNYLGLIEGNGLLQMWILTRLGLNLNRNCQRNSKNCILLSIGTFPKNISIQANLVLCCSELRNLLFYKIPFVSLNWVVVLSSRNYKLCVSNRISSDFGLIMLFSNLEQNVIFIKFRPSNLPNARSEDISSPSRGPHQLASYIVLGRLWSNFLGLHVFIIIHRVRFCWEILSFITFKLLLRCHFYFWCIIRFFLRWESFYKLIVILLLNAFRNEIDDLLGRRSFIWVFSKKFKDKGVQPLGVLLGDRCRLLMLYICSE